MRPDERSFTNLLNIGTSFPDRHEGTLTEEKRNGKNRLGGWRVGTARETSGQQKDSAEKTSLQSKSRNFCSIWSGPIVSTTS